MKECRYKDDKNRWHSCRSWRDCDGHEYYETYEVQFCRFQMLWLLANLLILKDGRYPPGTASGYIDLHLESNKTLTGRASFETPVGLAAEVEIRLDRCGLDGVILKAVVMWGEAPDRLAKGLKMEYQDVLRRQERALQYISGWRRRRITYKDFCSHQNR
jgi:hypothetical protein